MFCRSEGITAGNLAELLLRTDRPAEAMPYLQRAVHLLQEVGDPTTASQFLAALGEARVRLGDVQQGHVASLPAQDLQGLGGAGASIDHPLPLGSDGGPQCPLTRALGLMKFPLPHLASPFVFR